MLASWVQGEPAQSIPLDDRGLQYGDGLFETIGASGGRVRFLGAHLARLARGCAALAIAAPDETLLAREIARAAALAPHVIVKVIVTRGRAIARGYAYTGTETPTRIVAAWPWPEGPHAARDPATIALAGGAAGPPLLAGVKHLNRLGQVLAREEARQRGLDEVILADRDGRIIGGAMTNLFLCRDGQLATPPATHCAVVGVMRGQVLGAAARLGLATGERHVTVQELGRADAIWLTNVRVGLWPVGICEGQALAAHAWTQPLRQAIEAEAREARLA
ncbi:MAG: aminodeoxychorismate lyase [Steroidobacteraceae bacterium]